MAGRLGWAGPWRDVACQGLNWLQQYHLRDDGLYSSVTSPTGRVIDQTAMTYDQSFALLAAAALQGCGLGPGEDYALDLLSNLMKARKSPRGGFVEAGNRFLANPNMHLFEAALAWIEAGGRETWWQLADDIGTLAVERLVDPKTRVICESYDQDWRPASSRDQAVEPGHQFEWSWLLERWAKRTGDGRMHAVAVALFEAGSRGVDAGRGVAMDEIDAFGRARRTSARLWPQTERIKAAKLLRRDEDVCLAAKGLWQYLEHPRAGLWRDRLNRDGSFDEGPAPASSLYHIVCAVTALQG